MLGIQQGLRKHLSPTDEGPDEGPTDEGPDEGPTDEGPDEGPMDEGPDEGPTDEGPDEGPMAHVLSLPTTYMLQVSDFLPLFGMPW